MSKLTFTVKAVLIFISVVFLLLTLYIYLQLSELRETQVSSLSTQMHNNIKLDSFQDKVTIFTLINLTTFLSFLGIMQVQTPSENSFMNTCLVLAFIVYYFTIGYFAWLNCVIANLWKIVVLVTQYRLPIFNSIKSPNSLQFTQLESSRTSLVLIKSYLRMERADGHDLHRCNEALHKTKSRRHNMLVSP